MNYTTILICVLSILLVLISCKTIIKSTNAKSDLPVISMSKSSCFGKCKVFNFSIYENRRAIYQGVKYVDNIGEFDTVLNDEDYQNIRSIMDGNGFKNLDSSYLSSIRDLQKIKISLDQKEIEFHKRKAPKELVIITEHLDKLILKLQWNENL